MCLNPAMKGTKSTQPNNHLGGSEDSRGLKSQGVGISLISSMFVVVWFNKGASAKRLQGISN